MTDTWLIPPIDHESYSLRTFTKMTAPIESPEQISEPVEYEADLLQLTFV